MTALGLSAAQTMQSMTEGRCGIGQLEFPDVERLSTQIGGQIKDYEESAYFNRKELARYDRFTQFALLCAREAITASGLIFEGELALCSGVVLGTSCGGMHTQDANYRELYENQKNRFPPLLVPRTMQNAACSQVSMQHNLQGPSFTVSTACASSNHAMGLAFQMVRSGASKVMITGGAESTLCLGGIKIWEGLRVMSNDACRPFSRNRSGMVQGEGAGIFVFEEYEHARARGAEIYAEVTGFCMTSDAGDIVMPSQEGAARTIAGALNDARMDPDEVGYINAHGTATAANDRIECGAVMDVFAQHADRLMISSTKSMHGHLIGGTGAVELLACILALKKGIIAPTIGYEEPDPDCPLDVVPNEAREATVNAVLSNAFAFGGLNAVLALRNI